MVTLVILAKSHNLPADWARELFKPCKDLESLVCKIKKIILVSGLWFLVDDIRMGVGFAFFFGWRHRLIQWANFLAQNFLESKETPTDVNRSVIGYAFPLVNL